MMWATLAIAFGAVAAIALFSEPSDMSETWFADFVISKAIAAAAYVAMKMAYRKASEHYA